MIPPVLVAAISALTVIRYWSSSDPYPPGLDGAQWLSYGRAIFGSAGRGEESTYAPVIPAFAHGFGLVLGPFIGLRVLAVTVLVLLALAVSLLSVSVLGSTWGSLAAALVLPGTAMGEPFYYGGYPQQAALAFGLLGITSIAIANRAGNLSSQTRALTLAAFCFILASGSHLLYGPLLLISALLVALVMGAARVDRRRFMFRTAAALSPAAAISAMVALAFVGHGYHAPLAGTQRTLPEAWIYATRESPWLWTTIVVAGLLSSSFVILRNRTTSPSAEVFEQRSPAVIVGFALVAPGAFLFAASGQPRLAPPLLVGATILVGLTCRAMARAWAHARLPLLAAWCVTVLWLAGITTGLTREFAHYYQVLDASLVAATRSIPSPSTGTIAVAADRRGWPVGWWVEALQETPVFTGSNSQWLAFPDERTRAETVTALLTSPDASVLQQRARDTGVAYLMLRKWDWIGWERWIDDTPQAPVVIYDDNETIVLQIVSATS